MDPKMIKWRKDGKHLPKFFRDFHDQKAVMAAVHELTQWNKREAAQDALESKASSIDPTTGHIYIVDCFLWCMARHGYTLQKTRVQGIEFEDIEVNAQKIREEQQKLFTDMVFKNKEEKKDV